MSENNTFNYQLLSRLQMDCNYFLGNGRGYEGHLWADNVNAQINKMKELYNGFSDKDKPQWITMEDILDYEKRMNELKVLREQWVNLQLGNFEDDGEGYIHFTIRADDYQLDGLFRVYDPANGDSLNLVSIDYGYLHPIIAEKWNEIERLMTDYARVFSPDKYAAAQSSEKENKDVTIDGIDCYKLDEWQSGTVHYILGRDKNNDLEWYMVQALETMKGYEDTYTQEYDRWPSREAIEKSHKDILDSIAAEKRVENNNVPAEQENQAVNFVRRRGR